MCFVIDVQEASSSPEGTRRPSGLCAAPTLEVLRPALRAVLINEATIERRLTNARARSRWLRLDVHDQRRLRFSAVERLPRSSNNTAAEPRGGNHDR